MITLKPSKGLLQECVAPIIYKAYSVRDISRNSLNRQDAFDECAIRMRCVIAWFEGSEKSECGRFGK